MSNKYQKLGFFVEAFPMERFFSSISSSFIKFRKDSENFCVLENQSKKRNFVMKT
jgi:hypothetical protein